MMKRQIGICEGVRFGPRRIKSTVTDVQPTMPIINRANPPGGARCPRPERRFLVRRNRQKHRHGGRSGPLDSSLCHHSGRPPRARAPHAGRWRRPGRSPGSRVMILLRLPKLWCTKPSGNLKKDSPPTVAGAAPDLTRHR